MSKITILIIATLLLSGCSTARGLCSVAMTPYLLGVIAHNNTGENKTYLDFQNDKKACRKKEEKEISKILRQIRSENLFKDLKKRYSEKGYFSEFFISNAFQRSDENNMKQIKEIWEPKLPTYKDSRGVEYDASKQIEMLHEVIKSELNDKYSKQMHKIENQIEQCLLETYAPKELSKLNSLEFSSAPLPSKACIVF